MISLIVRSMVHKDRLPCVSPRGIPKHVDQCALIHISALLDPRKTEEIRGIRTHIPDTYSRGKPPFEAEETWCINSGLPVTMCLTEYTTIPEVMAISHASTTAFRASALSHELKIACQQERTVGMVAWAEQALVGLACLSPLFQVLGG